MQLVEMLGRRTAMVGDVGSYLGAGHLVLYGLEDCNDTLWVRGRLAELGVPFSYVAIEVDTVAHDLVLQRNDGKARTPMLAFGEQEFSCDLGEPELSQLLRARGYLA